MPRQSRALLAIAAAATAMLLTAGCHDVNSPSPTPATATAAAGSPQASATATAGPPSAPATAAPQAAACADQVSCLLGTYQTYVPGAFYTVGNADGTDTSVLSSGAQGETLTINADGTYTWAGFSGRWQQTGQNPTSGYPIEVDHGPLDSDGRPWLIGWDTDKGAKHGSIYAYDKMGGVYVGIR